MAAIGSDFQLDVSVSAPSYQPLSTLTFTATLTDRDLPVVDGESIVVVATPEGERREITLYDDGTHGDLRPTDGVWTNSFEDTRPQGVYQVAFQGSGLNDRGIWMSREAVRYVTISD
jgi:hypothetical protein